MTAWIIIGAIAVPFVIMAIFLLQGKGAFLIAGYNTMSEEKRATYDEKALCRSVGRLLLAITVLMFLFPLAFSLEVMWLLYIAVVLSLILPIGYVIYANTGNRYRKAPDPGASSNGEKHMPMSRGKKALLIIVIVLSAQLCIGIGIMFYQGERDPEVRLLSDRIQINAMYGLDVMQSDIADITLIDSSMMEIGVGTRTNGYGGSALKGNFSSAGLGPHLLFVAPGSSPTIRIERARGSDIYISFRDSAKTTATYNELSS